MNLELGNKGVVDIRQNNEWLDIVKDLEIVIIKPNKEGTKNVLTQSMINTPDTKYIINYSFDLRGREIRLPNNCIIEIDGGSLHNGTLIGDNSLIINTNKEDYVLDNIELKGTWKPADKKLIVLTEDEYLALQIKDPNTIYFTYEE